MTMPDDYVPYLIIVGGGLALWAVAAWAGWFRRRELHLAVDDPTEPDELMALADDVAEDTCSVPGEQERTAAYRPCGHTWHSDGDDCAGDCAGHRCDRLPGGHHRHVCSCGARSDDGPVLVVDPPVVPRYATPVVAAPLIGAAQPASPQPAAVTWVTFGTHRVHQTCLALRRDGRPITDGCRIHLIGAGNLPAGGGA